MSCGRSLPSLADRADPLGSPLQKAAREAEEKDRQLQKLQASWLQRGAGGMKQTL